MLKVRLLCLCVSSSDLGFETETLVQRRIYPSLLAAVLFSTYLVFQAKQFKKLYEQIKNDK